MPRSTSLYNHSSSIFTYASSSAASEVSSILENRIAGTSVGGDIQETGRVLSE